MNFLYRPKTLLAKTSVTLAGSLLLFAGFSTVLVIYFILLPMANRAADDMAAVVSFAAETWMSIAPHDREQFRSQLEQQHHLLLTRTDIPVTVIKQYYPFIPRLEKALYHHTGQHLSIKQDMYNSDHFWIPFSQLNPAINIGFSHDRMGPRPPIVFIGIFISGSIIILMTTLLLVRRITRPVKLLASAANQFGKGNLSEPVPETGPEELASLARSFNGMAQELSQLLANRTTLFAGISHDLRTPITRMKIALELLEEDPDSTLMKGLQSDLEEMMDLISKTLELAKGLDKHDTVNIDLDAFISDMVMDYRRSNRIIQWQSNPCGIVEIEIHALRRVLANLIDNAFYYDETASVELSCTQYSGQILICIMDRGPGIPEHKREAVFQPFHRLDTSRSKKTGGSGLGLAIVRQLCDAHGWTVRLLSREGAGTEVRLEISSKSG